jgi:hypothetical protein
MGGYAASMFVYVLGSGISMAVYMDHVFGGDNCPHIVSQAYHSHVLCPKLIIWVVLPFPTAEGRMMRVLLTQRPSSAIIGRLCTSAPARSWLEFFKEGFGRQMRGD